MTLQNYPRTGQTIQEHFQAPTVVLANRKEEKFYGCYH